MALDELARIAFPAITNDQAAQEFTTALLAVLSHERAREDAPRNSFPNLEAHLWLREITRVDRVVAAAPSFRWSDAAARRTATWPLPADLLPPLRPLRLGRHHPRCRRRPRPHPGQDSEGLR